MEPDEHKARIAGFGAHELLDYLLALLPECAAPDGRGAGCTFSKRTHQLDGQFGPPAVVHIVACKLLAAMGLGQLIEPTTTQAGEEPLVGRGLLGRIARRHLSNSRRRGGRAGRGGLCPSRLAGISPQHQPTNGA